MQRMLSVMVVCLVLLLVGPLYLRQPLRENSGLLLHHGGPAGCMKPGRLPEEQAEMTSDLCHRSCPDLNKKRGWDSQESLQILSVGT